ncbi:MAG: hypothetical protein ACPLRA_06890 [Candidatus Saccharicenans sp.]
MGIIKSYAIGGGIAATYYTEPILTYDLDVFFIPVKEGFDVLGPIYEFAKERGYKFEAEAILIEDFPVQFIPVYNDLVREAVENAAEVDYGQIKVRIVRAEYLTAIALQTGRPKDRERALRLLESEATDRVMLNRILEKYGLMNKLKKVEESYGNG